MGGPHDDEEVVRHHFGSRFAVQDDDQERACTTEKYSCTKFSSVRLHSTFGTVRYSKSTTRLLRFVLKIQKKKQKKSIGCIVLYKYHWTFYTHTGDASDRPVSLGDAADRPTSQSYTEATRIPY